MTVRNDVRAPAALAGPDSTSPSDESGWSIASASATSPPKLWPSTKRGAPGCCPHTSARNASKSSTTNARRSTYARGPSDRPWPRWSSAYDRVPPRDERVDHVAVSAGVLAEPVRHDHHAPHGPIGHPAPPEQLDGSDAGAETFDRLPRRHGRTTTLIEPVRLSAAVTKASCTRSSSNSMRHDRADTSASEPARSSERGSEVRLAADV